MNQDSSLNVCIIVAHPDDETLWAGGMILMHPQWRCFILSLCRASDPDRAPRFKHALSNLGALGTMADMDDGPEQHPLSLRALQETIMTSIDPPVCDLLLSHGTNGEYTRHRRHEEASRAVLELVQSGEIRCQELWQFAYEDGCGQYVPRADAKASVSVSLPDDTWKRKYKIITGIYGFAPDSWEARATPRTEAFRRMDIHP